MGRYQEVFRRSLEDPDGFWSEAARSLRWRKQWDRVLDKSRPDLPRWFQGGEINTCENALDVHVESGRADQLALIWDSAVTHSVAKFTYRELRDEVALFAGALKKLGVGKGDRVIIYMPMVPQAIVAMLACARIGAVHSVVFGGFAAPELAARINHAKPKLVVWASCGIEPGRVVPYKPMIDKALEQSVHKPSGTVVLQRPQHEAELVAGRDLEWNEALQGATPAACVPLSSNDPLYVLYTSGTTGQPKGIVRDNGGHAVALRWSMEFIYGAKPGEAYWAASDIGWVVGHSYIVYAPLLHGCTTILYEGKPVGTPDAGAFWRVIAQHDVKTLFTAPTAFRAIKREDPQGNHIRKHDAKLRALFLAGERCDPDTLVWAQERLKIPVIDHWWQTETGWPIAANPFGLEFFPVKPGSATKPMPGYDVRVVDEQGNDAPKGEQGAIVIRLPLPPGCLPGLYEDPAGLERAYLSRFPGNYLTGDGGHIDEDGYLSIMGRIDDVINVAGHRLSTGAMEEVLASHQDVAECAVVGVNDSLKGEVPVGFVVLKAGVQREEPEICRELVQMVRDRIGPVAFFKTAAVVKKLPKTRSGKILRGTIRKIADGLEYKVPATIEDAGTLEEVTATLKRLGYPA
jgi:propionyl-CoA synthetase